MKPVAEKGFLIVAINRPECNYVSCAELLAKSIRYYHPDVEIGLLTNDPVPNPELFTQIRSFPYALVDNAFANDWQVFHATPFRETIKLEADMLITHHVDHWWTLLRNRDIVISTGCRDWQDREASARHYRQVFDQNQLPDVYNAITYWRRSETAQEFFQTVRAIFENWEQYRALLKFPEAVPSTDVVYAMAAKIIGPERCTMPFASYPQIVHMKRHIIASEREKWQDELLWEYNDYILRVESIAQLRPFHYHRKEWAKDLEKQWDGND